MTARATLRWIGPRPGWSGWSAPTRFRSIIPPTARALTPRRSARDKVYDANSTATVDWTQAGLVGVLSGDKVSLDHAAYGASFETKTVGASKPVTVSGVTLVGVDAGDYTVAQPAGLTAKVSAK